MENQKEKNSDWFLTEEAVRSLKEGNEDAFSFLLQQYAPLLESLSAQYASADDVCLDRDEMREEARIALYRAALTYRTGGVTFGLYAKVCIRNRLTSCLRRKSAEKKNAELYFVVNEKIPDTESPEEKFFSSVRFQELYGRIRDSLTAYEWKVFDCCYSGLSYHEAAQRLGVSEKSYGNAVYRMRSKLRKLI